MKSSSIPRRSITGVGVGSEALGVTGVAAVDVCAAEPRRCVDGLDEIEFDRRGSSSSSPASYSWKPLRPASSRNPPEVDPP